MADPFDKYLAPAPANNKQEQSDPFATFIGPETSPSKDPFAQYLDTEAIDKEIADRSFFDRPVLGAEYTKEQELAAIARKHGVDPKELIELAPYFGARIEGSEFISEPELKRAGGAVGSVLLNVPQKLYKKYKGGQLEAALDDVQALASGRQSYTQLVGEAAVPGVGVGGRAVSTSGRIISGAATGAVAGYSGASREQELAGTLFGAGVGGTAATLAGWLSRAAKTPQEADTAIKVLKQEGAGLDEGTERILKDRANSEQDLKAIYQGTQEIGPDGANRIVREQIDPDFVAKVMDPATEEGRLMREALERDSPDLVAKEGFNKALEQRLAKDYADKRVKDFAQELTNDSYKSAQEARTAIKEVAAREGQDAIATKYNLFVQEQAALDYIKRQAIRLGRGDNFQDKALNALSDAQFVLRDIDDRAGTSLEPIHRRMNSAYNRLTFAKNDARHKLNQIFKQNKDIDQELTAGIKVYNALDSGDYSQLSPKERQAAVAFKQYFNDQLDYVNNLVKSKDKDIAPLSIPKRDNYVPHILASTEDLLAKINDRIEQVKQLVSNTSGRQIDDLAQMTPQEWKQLATSQPLKELTEALKVFDSRQATNPADLSARLKDTFNTRAGRLKLETVARAALERQGQIPMWMRETNLYKLADKWSGNTLRHLYLRRDMDAFRSIANRLDKAGAELEASYVRNLLSDLNGIRKGTMAERVRQGELEYQQYIDRMADKASGPVSRGAMAVAKAIPTILGDINKQVYPNLLGLSPRALLMNATQTISKTAPELGTKYGYTTLMRGALQAVLNRRTMMRRLEQQGFVPAEYVSKYRQAVADGIRRSSLYSIPNETLNAMGNAAMYFYTKMDAVNRAIALGTADMMASDLAKGSKLAQESLRKFPASVQRQVAKASNEQEIADILASHLNASTQYNYNKASMSEYGRVMGPLFSTFSKWPTATLGEMVQEYRQRGLVKGTLRNAEKYAAPLLLFQAADYLLYGNDPEQMSDRQKKLLGVGGLSQASPIGSVEGILKGDFFTPPAVDAVTQAFVVPALEQDQQKLTKGLASAIQNFTPGSVYVRVLTDDLPTLITGERPEGSNFIERTISGTKEILK